MNKKKTHTHSYSGLQQRGVTHRITVKIHKQIKCIELTIRIRLKWSTFSFGIRQISFEEHFFFFNFIFEISTYIWFRINTFKENINPILLSISHLLLRITPIVQCTYIVIVAMYVLNTHLPLIDH